MWRRADSPHALRRPAPPYFGGAGPVRIARTIERILIHPAREEVIP
jgi:hypothetical protein